MAKDSADAQSGRQRLHFLSLPTELRMLILKMVLEHEHENFRPHRTHHVAWTKMKAPAKILTVPEPVQEIFLQQHDWPHAGLLLCNRQLATEVAEAMRDLKKIKGNQNRRRILDFYVAEQGRRLYLTWTGLSWVRVPSCELEIDAHIDLTQWCMKFTIGGVGMVPGSDALSEVASQGNPPLIRPVFPEILSLLNAFLHFGPRLRKGLRWGPQRDRMAVIDRFKVNLRHVDILPDTFDPLKPFAGPSAVPLKTRGDRLYSFWHDGVRLIPVGPNGFSPQTAQRVKHLRVVLQSGPRMGVWRVKQADFSHVGLSWFGPNMPFAEEISSEDLDLASDS